MRTRFAPSPTGWLHLGHVANALWTWETAARCGAAVVLRIEDHDRGRCRPAYERQLLDDLAWLGFMPEPESAMSLRRAPSPFRQSDCGAIYEAALARLAHAGLVYGCDCSRSAIAAQAGDAAADGVEPRYAGTCRDRRLPLEPGLGIRVRLPDTTETFDDLRLGPQVQHPQQQCGDLLVRDRLGNWTYQFAVTVDDLRHGIDLVVRGEDLLGSTGRQMALARLLGRDVPPRFLHHPLIRNAAGIKLSKKDDAPGLRDFRAAGWLPADVLAEARQAAGNGLARRE